MLFSTHCHVSRSNVFGLAASEEDNHPSIISIMSHQSFIIHHSSSIIHIIHFSRPPRFVPIIKPGVERHGGQLDPHGTGLQCAGNPAPWPGLDCFLWGPSHLGMEKNTTCLSTFILFISYKDGSPIYIL